jgi:hypothetical protein
MKDTPQVIIDEEIMLEKFEGEPLPENLIERVFIKNGKIIRIEKVGEGK